MPKRRAAETAEVDQQYKTAKAESLKAKAGPERQEAQKRAQALKRRLDQIKDKKQVYIPTISPLEVGAVGKLPSPDVRVERTADSLNAIISIPETETGTDGTPKTKYTTVWIRGHDTSRWTPGKTVTLDISFRIPTSRQATGFGKILMIEPYDPTDLLKKGAEQHAIKEIKNPRAAKAVREQAASTKFLNAKGAFASGNLLNAKRMFQEIIDEYPGTKAAAAASQMLKSSQ